jgi:hypothetical protein
VTVDEVIFNSIIPLILHFFCPDGNETKQRKNQENPNRPALIFRHLLNCLVIVVAHSIHASVKVTLISQGESRPKRGSRRGLVRAIVLARFFFCYFSL